VPSIGPNPPATRDERIDVARHTNGQAAHSLGERALVRRFDQQVNVVCLHREVNDAKRIGIVPVGLANGVS
jgi:hypothetical protein